MTLFLPEDEDEDEDDAIDDRKDIEEFLAGLDHMQSRGETIKWPRRSSRVVIDTETWQFMNTYDVPTPPEDLSSNGTISAGVIHQANPIMVGCGTIIDVRPRNAPTGQALPVQPLGMPVQSSNSPPDTRGSSELGTSTSEALPIQEAGVQEFHSSASKSTEDL